MSKTELRRRATRVIPRKMAPVAAMTVLLMFVMGSALAMHNDGVFQLDGDTNPATHPAGITGDDWDQLDDGVGDPNGDDNALVSAFVPDDLSQTTDQIYTGGSTKDDLDTTGWQHTAGSVPDKDNIEHAFAALYNTCLDGADAGTAPDKCLYFGLDRFARNGDAQVGFWFFKKEMTPLANGSFANPHTVGDILVLSNFTNGGVVGTVQVFKWAGNCDNDPDATCINHTLDLIAAEGSCLTANTEPDQHDSCGDSNTSQIQSGWVYDAKSINGTNNPMPQGSFYEGGINLSTLGLADTCVSSFIAETRSSQSVDAVLKDFAYGAFPLCSANIQVGLDGTNQINQAHTVTGHVNVVQAGVSTNAPLGTTINFTIVSGPGTLSSASCTTTDASGSCSVTLNSSVTGTTTVHAASTVTVAGSTFNVETNGSGLNSDDLTKVWVDANVSVENDGTNAVGSPHTVTGHVNVSTAANPPAYANAPAGTTINFSILSGPGTLSAPSCATIGTTGTCTVTLNSAVPGTTIVRASTTVTVGGISVTRSTATAATGGNGDDLDKLWVDANVSVENDGTNEINVSHTVTGHVNVSTAANPPAYANAPAGTTITFTKLSGPGTLSASSCTTIGTTGSCSVTLTSAVSGTTVIRASTTVSVGGVSLTRSTATSATGGNGDDLDKVWVDANVSVESDDTNGIGEPHTVTGHVNVSTAANPPAYANAPADTTINFSILSGPGTLSAPSCTTIGTTGTCTVTLNSSVAGTTIVRASTTVSVGGVSLTRSTATSAANGNGDDLDKVWVDGTLRWLKHDGAGNLLGGAVFTVCRTETFNSDTSTMVNTADVCNDVYDENDGDAGTSGDADATLGEFQLNNLVLGRYTIVEKTPPPGYHGDSHTATVDLTIANRSNADGEVLPVFVNTQAYRLIVITCDDISHKLVVSSVDLDGAGPGLAVNSMSAADLAAYNTAWGTSLTEAQVCGTGTAGTPSLGGAASFGDLAPATYNPRVQIPL